MDTMRSTIPSKYWGKDHFFLLSFLETICVDNHGTIAKKQITCMSCDEVRHPQWAHWRAIEMSGPRGVPEYRLKDRISTEMDDWDGLDDFVRHGLATLEEKHTPWVREIRRRDGKSYAKPRFWSDYKASAKISLTDIGLDIALDIRRWKAKGGSWGAYQMPVDLAAKIPNPTGPAWKPKQQAA